jgi:hypothetical protein
VLPALGVVAVEVGEKACKASRKRPRFGFSHSLGRPDRIEVFNGARSLSSAEDGTTSYPLVP